MIIMKYDRKALINIENLLVANISNVFLRSYKNNTKLKFLPLEISNIENINKRLINLAKKDAIYYIGTQYYDNILFAAEDKESKHLTELMIAYFLIINNNIDDVVTKYAVTNNITKFQAFEAIGNTKLGSYIRTMANDVHTQILLKSYRQAGVQYFKFVAVLDSRTSDICRFMNGKIFDNNNVDFYHPPLHPYCRSTVFPIASEDVARKNMFVAMPEKLTKTFNWFKSTYALDIDALQISLNNISVNV